MNEAPSTPEQSHAAHVRLARALLAVMLLQSAAGVAAPHLYRDVKSIQVLWLGNDWVTLLLACPLLLLAVSGARLRAARWQVLRIGLLGYALYNYAFYLLGAALSAFFLLYVVAFVVSLAALVTTLASSRVGSTGAVLGPRTPIRAIAGYMMVLAGVIALVWVALWARYVFAGAAPPGGPEMFRLVAAMDLTFMLPALGLGGVLLWRRSAWGVSVASLALVQASLYLLVLSVNVVVALARGSAAWPGELPVWGSMWLATTIAAVALVAGVRASWQERGAAHPAHSA